MSSRITVLLRKECRETGDTLRLKETIQDWLDTFTTGHHPDTWPLALAVRGDLWYVIIDVPPTQQPTAIVNLIEMAAKASSTKFTPLGLVPRPAPSANRP